jgi:cbb3-type cytochrome oxidase subunit 3
MPDGPSALAGDTATMVPETHELSTRAIVLITLGAISATITLLAIIWYAYSTLRKRTDISQRRKLSRKSRSLVSTLPLAFALTPKANI